MVFSGLVALNPFSGEGWMLIEVLCQCIFSLMDLEAEQLCQSLRRHKQATQQFLPPYY